VSCYYSAADKARAEYEYEFSEQDRAEYEGYEQEERRDYQAEAAAIASGQSLLLTEKAHVIALHEYIQALEADLNYVRQQNEMLRASHPAFAAARKANASEVFMHSLVKGVK
jgi:outer membrane receptor for Fe3+-dicitrate